MSENAPNKKKYDSTVARMAGNIAAGLVGHASAGDSAAADEYVVVRAVWMARQIIAQVERTEPAPAVNAVDPSAQLPGTLSTRDRKGNFE